MIGRVLCGIGAGLLLSCFAGMLTAAATGIDWRVGVWLAVFVVRGRMYVTRNVYRNIKGPLRKP